MSEIKLIQGDCLKEIKNIPEACIDCICTDPPYLYLKNQKLDKPFDEDTLFSEWKRVLKKGGFVILFGRGTSFYRWNYKLSELGFEFKEEIIWDKGYCTSPLMPISRVHETISIYCNGKGKIIKNKIPYLEMKEYDIDSICQDIKRMRSIFNNPKSLESVQSFLENNKVPTTSDNVLSTSISSVIKTQDRGASVIRGMQNGMNEKSIIRTDFNKNDNSGLTGASSIKCEKAVNVMQSIDIGMNEKTIVNVDSSSIVNNYEGASTSKYLVTRGPIKDMDRCAAVMKQFEFGMSEKTIIKQVRDHYTAIHPTQKPTRLLERLLNLVCGSGALVLDCFSGSGSTAIACINTNRGFIGFEIDKEYYDLSKQRIDNAIKEAQERLF